MGSCSRIFPLNLSGSSASSGLSGIQRSIIRGASLVETVYTMKMFDNVLDTRVH